MLSAICLNLDKSKILASGNGFKCGTTCGKRSKSWFTIIIFLLFVNSLPNDKILDWSKLKAFANDILKLAKRMVFVSDRVENIVGKGENAGYIKSQSICRRQNKCNLTTDVLFWMDRIHCGKRRKCWLPAFSPFVAMFLKAFFFRVVNSRDYVVKSYFCSGQSW